MELAEKYMKIIGKKEIFVFLKYRGYSDLGNILCKDLIEVLRLKNVFCTVNMIQVFKSL